VRKRDVYLQKTQSHSPPSPGHRIVPAPYAAHLSPHRRYARCKWSSHAMLREYPLALLRGHRLYNVTPQASDPTCTWSHSSLQITYPPTWSHTSSPDHVHVRRAPCAMVTPGPSVFILQYPLAKLRGHVWYSFTPHTFARLSTSVDDQESLGAKPWSVHAQRSELLPDCSHMPPRGLAVIVRSASSRRNIHICYASSLWPSSRTSEPHLLNDPMWCSALEGRDFSPLLLSALS
jgi:hypothetical protein